MHKKTFDFRPISRYAFRFDGGGSDSAPAGAGESTPPASKDQSQGTAGDNKGTNADTNSDTANGAGNKPFKTFASEEDYQRDINFKIQQALKTHEENLKNKLTPEIKKQLEKEANMTAEQKYQEQLKQLEEDKKAVSKAKVRVKVESLFASKGISEADRQTMLDAVVDSDEEESTKRAKALIASIEKAANEQVKAQMLKVRPPKTGKGSEGDENKPDGNDTASVKFAKSLAKKRASASKSSNDILDQWIHGRK